MGGGTGLPNVIKALSRMPAFDSKAIVNVVDDGGSSGKLRECLGVLPPGDARNCLNATATNKNLSELFDYRFKAKCDLDQHNLGNLIIAALNKKENSFEAALDRASELLGSQIKVIPATNEAITLSARTKSGKVINGQRNIAETEEIEKVMLNPPNPKADTFALEALALTDIIIIGPGSLFSSIIPSLLIPQIKEAIMSSQPKIIFISNILSFRKETFGLTLDEHVFALLDNCSYLKIHSVIAQDPGIAEQLVRQCDIKNIELLYPEGRLRDVKIIYGDLASFDNPRQHSDNKLSAMLSNVLNEF